jgi:hypothetical protein
VLYNRSFNFRQAHPPIQAKLEGSRRCSAQGLTVVSYAPVCALGRKLVRAGFDPDSVLEVYRKVTLCFRVRLGSAARLTVEDGPNGTPRFRSYRAQGWVVRPPVAPIQQPTHPENALCGGGS